MIGWWTVLDVIEQIKGNARQPRDEYCPLWLAVLLGAISWAFLLILLIW